MGPSPWTKGVAAEYRNDSFLFGERQGGHQKEPPVLIKSQIVATRGLAPHCFIVKKDRKAPGHSGLNPDLSIGGSMSRTNSCSQSQL